MIVGVLILDIFIPVSSSLKEKRFVLKSLKDRLKNKFNVSVAELKYQDKWQRAQIGIAAIGNEQSIVEKSLQKIFRILDGNDNFEITNYQFEYL